MVAAPVAKARSDPRQRSPRAASNSVPAKARPIGTIATAAIYLRSIMLDLLHKLLIRRRRDRSLIDADYEAGDWMRQLRGRNWEKSGSLREYVDRRWLDRPRRVQIQGRLWSLPTYEFYRFRRARLVEIMKRFASPDATLVELGSGTGSIAFELTQAGIWPKILGLELSPTGREVARNVAEHLKAHKVEFAEIDLLDPESKGYRKLAGQTVYTHYCLEQLPEHTEEVFRNLVRARIKRAILIEPSYELLKWLSLRDLASMTYVLRQDYQRSILRVAKQLESEGLIHIVHVERLDFVSSHRNAGTLLVFDVRDLAAN
jgi:hypothetical protein